MVRPKFYIYSCQAIHSFKEIERKILNSEEFHFIDYWKTQNPQKQILVLVDGSLW